MKPWRFQFGLRALILAVALIGYDCNVVRSASDIDGEFLLNVDVAVFALVTAALCLTRCAASRFFNAGFCLAGWAYLVASCSPWFAAQAGPYLPTTWAITYLWRATRNSSFASDCGVEVVSEWFNVQTVGHSLIAIHVAFVGGLAGPAFFNRKKPFPGEQRRRPESK
jgi:hypothetical protein